MSEKKNISVKNVKDGAAFVVQHPPSPVLSDEERQKYTLRSPFPQDFTLPSNIIYYIAKNPAFPNGHLKLISTCKFLARMSRVLPVEKLWHYDWCEDDIDKWNVKSEVSINLKDHFFKLWIWDSISISGLFNLATTLVKQIYKFSIRNLFIHNYVLTIKELQILVSGDQLESVRFMSNIVKNDDGSITEFEKVFELLCCKKTTMQVLSFHFSIKMNKFLSAFHPEHHGIGKNTTKKIIEILSSDQIPVEQNITLGCLPQDFDFHSFSEFLKANMTGRQHTIDLYFADEISEEYKNQLQVFVNEIIQIREIYARTVPFISFHGQNKEACKELYKMRGETVE